MADKESNSFVACGDDDGIYCIFDARENEFVDSFGDTKLYISVFIYFAQYIEQEQP